MKLHASTLPLLTALLLAPASLSLGGCSSNKASSKSSASATYKKPAKPAKQDVSLEGLTGSERTLVSEARSWLGTPYKYGGNTRDGVDCSGFVYHVYRNSLDISLPRNSTRQHEYCSKVKRDDLATGDLVFFATNKGSRKVSHVGLYVGDGKMIHASTRRGVIVQDLSDDYYTKAYVGAGRVSEFATLNRSTKKSKAKPKGKDKAETPAPAPSPAPASPVTPSATESPKPADTPAPIEPDAPAATEKATQQQQPAEVTLPEDSPFYEFDATDEPTSATSTGTTGTTSSTASTGSTSITAATGSTATPDASNSATIPAAAPQKPVKISTSNPANASPATNAGAEEDARSRVLSTLPDLQ